MATKEVIYRKRQGIGLPYIIHVKIILFNQMIKERTSIMTRAEQAMKYKYLVGGDLNFSGIPSSFFPIFYITFISTSFSQHFIC